MLVQGKSECSEGNEYITGHSPLTVVNRPPTQLICISDIYLSTDKYKSQSRKVWYTESWNKCQFEKQSFLSLINCLHAKMFQSSVSDTSLKTRQLDFLVPVTYSQCRNKPLSSINMYFRILQGYCWQVIWLITVTIQGQT